MPKKIIITDEIMQDFLDVSNQKSLNSIMEEKYEAELKEWRSEQEVLKNATPVKIAAISAGITPHSQMKDFNTQGVGQWLYPAYIDERLSEEVGQMSILPYLVNGSVAANSLSVMSTQLNIFSDPKNKDATRMKRVAEGADLPIAELKLGERAISLFKYGRAVQATYEALAYMRVDLFSKTLNLIAADVSDQQAERALDVLVNGDGNKNPIKSITTAASGDTVTQDDLLELMIAFQRQAKVPVTTIVTGEKFYKQIFKMKYPNDQIPGVNFNFTFTTPQFSNQNVKLVWADNIPQVSGKDPIIALNTDLALVKYTAPNLNIREISKNIRNQTQLGTISEISGFGKFADVASLAMVSK